MCYGKFDLACIVGCIAALGMASPNSAFTTMVTTFGLAGIVGKCLISEFASENHRDTVVQFTERILVILEFL